MSGSVLEFQPRRFRSTVPYDARYRLGYPDPLVRRVADLCRLKPGERVLGLGCGPGLLALCFARLGAAVVAVDPEPDMLAAGRAAAAALRIDFREGSPFDLPAGLAAFEAGLRAALLEFAPGSTFTEIAEIRAVIARRP